VELFFVVGFEGSRDLKEGIDFRILVILAASPPLEVTSSQLSVEGVEE